MKKFLIASSVAVLAFASVAAAQGYMFNTNLTVGSTGPDVSALQSWLMTNGFNIPAISAGTAKGYFGSQTLAAVKLYQASRGIPNTGFVGPLTRGALNAGGGVAGGGCPAGQICTPINTVVTCPIGYICTPVGGNPSIPSTGGLAGTDGLISDVDELSQYSDEEVGDGKNDVKVLGMDVEASSDGDIRLKSIKVSFDATGNSGSDNLDDYIESVSIWLGSTKIGSADVSGFNEDSSGVWSRTITLSGDAVIRSDDTAKVYVAVDAVNNLDSGDISGDSWTVDVESIRFEDGSGVTTTDSTTGDINGMDVGIAFVSFSTASDTELKITTHSTNPEGTIVVVDENDVTEDVLLLVGRLELEGTADVTLDEFPVTFTVAGTATGLASTSGSVKLMLGDNDYTESVSSSFNTAASSVTFDNLDFDIEAGETVTFKVFIDILGTDGALTAGDSVKASITASNRDLMDVENEEGDQLSDSTEKSGSATGDFFEFRTEGIGLTLLSTATDATEGTSANDDIGLFTIKFKVTAIGNSIYVSTVATTTSYGYAYTVDKGGTATTSNTIAAAIVNNDDATVSTYGNFLVEEGDSEDFTLSVSVPLGTGGTSGQYRLALTGVKWGTTDQLILPNSYTSDLDSFKTAYKVLN